jgi:hypothetical protein
MGLMFSLQLPEFETKTNVKANRNNFSSIDFPFLIFQRSYLKPKFILFKGTNEERIDRWIK